MNIKEFVKTQWQMFSLQIIGAGYLIPAFILAIVAARTGNITVHYLAWFFLAAVGATDLHIIWNSKRKGIPTVTITRWIRNLFRKQVDNIIMFGFIALVWWLAGPLFALFYVHGFLNDHFNEDR